MQRIYISLFSVLLIASFFQSSVYAQKTDTVYHVNGDVMTGDFKKMIYGVTSWSMHGMGTINLEDVVINTIKSRKLFEIKLKSGLIYYGSFDTSGVFQHVNILMESGKEKVRITEIVEIYPIKRNFWMRTSGNFNLGLNYSKGSQVASLAFSGNLNYRKRKSYLSLTWEDNNTIQTDTVSATNLNVNFAWQRLLKKEWSIESSVGANQNSELGTKLRLSYSLIGIRDISYNSWNRLYAGAGLNVTRETSYTDSQPQTDLIGVLQVVWRVYKYTAPKVWVDASINFLPYITNFGRYRSTIALNPSISVFQDNFKVGLNFYFAYDSDPPADAPSTNDYGINLTLSYSFH